MKQFILSVALFASASILLSACRHMGGGGYHHSVGDGDVPALPALTAIQGCGGGGGGCGGSGHHGSNPSPNPSTPAASGHHGSAQSPATPAAAPAGGVYPFGTCPVSGELLGDMGEPVARTYFGRELRFCCAACPPKFEMEPARYLAAVDQRIIADQRAMYPLDVSPISGRTLGSEGDPVELVYRNRLVRLASESEKQDFPRQAAAVLARIDESAAARQRASYPVDYCVVDGMKLGAETVEFVVAGRLVRACRASDREAFARNPSLGLARLDAAWNAMGGYPCAGEAKAEVRGTPDHREHQGGHDHGGH